MHKRPLFGAPRILVRRHRAFVGLLGVLGLFAGIAFGLVGSSQPSASAVVFVPSGSTDSGGTPSPDQMATQRVIATSSGVLAPALKSLSLPIPVNELKVTAAAPANSNILRIDVKAPQRQQAVQLANAVATGYIQYVGRYGVMSGKPILLQPATTKAAPRSLVMSSIDGIGGLVAGLAIGSVILWKDRREWRDVQLICG
jgi:hypothetical protein